MIRLLHQMRSLVGELYNKGSSQHDVYMELLLKYPEADTAHVDQVVAEFYTALTNEEINKIREKNGCS